MLLYSNYTFWRIVFTIRGSVIYRAQNMFNGLMVAVFTTLLVDAKRRSFWIVEDLIPPNNLGWNMMGGTIVFAVVFRTSLGWQRYWEAMTQLQSMYSKWTDAYTQCHAFFHATVSLLKEKNLEDAEAKIGLLKSLRVRLRDRFSLLSALAAHRLTHGDVQRMDKRAFESHVKWKDQVVLRREMRVGEDLTKATCLPGFCPTMEIDEINSERHMQNDWLGEYTVTGEVSDKEAKVLEKCADRVNAVMYWIVHDLTIASAHLSVAPPIQSRVFQEMSNGALAYSNAIKISDVPFPFHFSQLFNLLVCAFTLFIPLYSAVFTNSLILSPVLAFVVHQTLCVINHVACELETPFGCEANDLSLRDFHARFLEGIVELEKLGEFKDTQPLDKGAPDCVTIDGTLAALKAASLKRRSVSASASASASGAGPANAATTANVATTVDLSIQTGTSESKAASASWVSELQEEQGEQKCLALHVDGDQDETKLTGAFDEEVGKLESKSTKGKLNKAKTPKEASTSSKKIAGKGLTINVYGT